MKINQNKHDDELAELDIKLSEAEHELVRCKDKVKELVDNKEKDEIGNDEWISKVYKNMSSAGRKDFIIAFTMATPLLKRGTISRLRRTTGIHFAITTANTEEEESELKKKIVDFAKENTIDVPDKKNI